MSANKPDTIYTLRYEIKQVIEGTKKAAKEFLEAYPNTAINIPEEYHSLKKISYLYEIYEKLMRYQDEVIIVFSNLEMVLVQMREINREKLTRDLTNNYSELASFKKEIEESINELERYKYALGDIKRATGDKVKILQSIVYHANTAG